MHQVKSYKEVNGIYHLVVLSQAQGSNPSDKNGKWFMVSDQSFWLHACTPKHGSQIDFCNTTDAGAGYSFVRFEQVS